MNLIYCQQNGSAKRIWRERLQWIIEASLKLSKSVTVLNTAWHVALHLISKETPVLQADASDR